MHKFSGLSEQALKSNKKYTEPESDWVCYWHGLSGDDLVSQIITVAHKPTDSVYSFTFSEVSGFYKLGEIPEIQKNIEGIFNVENVQEAVDSVLQFLDDAKIEYTGKSFIKEAA
jgi:hypothetical protein